MRQLTVFTFFIVLFALTVPHDAHGDVTVTSMYVQDQSNGQQTQITNCTPALSLNTPQPPGTYTCNIPTAPNSYNSFNIGNYATHPPQIVIYDGGGTSGNYLDVQYAHITPIDSSHPAPNGQIVVSATFTNGVSNDYPSLSRSCKGNGESGGWTDFNGAITPTGAPSAYVLDIPYRFANNLLTSCGGTVATSGLSTPLDATNGEIMTYIVTFTMTGTASTSFFDINGVDTLAGVAQPPKEPPIVWCPVRGYQQLPTDDPKKFPLEKCQTALKSKKIEKKHK